MVDDYKYPMMKVLSFKQISAMRKNCRIVLKLFWNRKKSQATQATSRIKRRLLVRGPSVKQLKMQINWLNYYHVNSMMQQRWWACMKAGLWTSWLNLRGIFRKRTKMYSVHLSWSSDFEVSSCFIAPKWGHQLLLTDQNSNQMPSNQEGCFDSYWLQSLSFSIILWWLLRRQKCRIF